MPRWLVLATALALSCTRVDAPRERARTTNSPGLAAIAERPIPAPPPEPTVTASPWWSWLGHFSKPTHARGVTPLDEVPDSTWFTNRNAVRARSPEEIRRGPGLNPAPRDDQQWVVSAMKHHGVAVGVRARDEAGDEFFLKFDPQGHDEVETGADVVVQRLLFAAGYNVSENDVVYFRREDLSVAPPLSEAQIDRLLARAAREPDGRYRALASRFVPGTPIGGTRAVGTRLRDPNDRIPHEDRRDTRGLYTIAAWLNHTDVKPSNTLDTWIADPRDPSRGYVVHYLLDFGKALGAMARIEQRHDVGYAHHGERGRFFVEHLTAGTPVPWAGIGTFLQRRGLGWIESEHFDATSWKPLFSWLPFERADRFDKAWGARIVASFTREQIRAALEAARYTDPQTVEYLERVLVERQRKTVAQLFRDVAPLAHFELRGSALCFVDLWTRHGLGGEATYTARLDRVTLHALADREGTVCFADLPSPAVVEIRVARPSHRAPATRVRIDTPGITAIERS